MSDCKWPINNNWRVLGRSFVTFKVADKTSRSAIYELTNRLVSPWSEIDAVMVFRLKVRFCFRRLRNTSAAPGKSRTRPNCIWAGTNSCCTEFWLLHILLHKRPPKPPKTPHLDVVLCAVSA